MSDKWSGDNWGQDAWGGLSEPYTPSTSELSKPSQQIDSPFRFTDKCDLLLVEHEAAVDNDLKNATFVRSKGLALFEFGAGVEELVFDPLDFATEVYVSDKIATSIVQGGIRVRVLEESIQYQEQENKLSVAVPYIDLTTGRGATALLAIPRSRTDS